MAKTARATIFPFWYNMEGTEEENKKYVEETGLDPCTVEVSEDPFMVHLKPLNGQEQLALKDYMVMDKVSGNVDYSADGLVKAIKMGLIGWRNINDDNGQPLAFSVSTALDILARDELRLIGYQIAIGSQISEEDRKK